MGFFIPACVTTDSVRFFAFGRTKYNGEGKDIYLLVKSNDNPDYTLKNLTWIPVSAVPTAGLNALIETPTFNSYSCTIDDTGVFSIVGFDLINIHTNGLQYQPSATDGSSANLYGSGAWKNITMPKDYSWDYGYQSALFSFKDSLGKNTLMHAFSNRFGTSVYVAALDPVSMTMIQGNTPWNFVSCNSLSGLIMA